MDYIAGSYPALVASYFDAAADKTIAAPPARLHGIRALPAPRPINLKPATRRAHIEMVNTWEVIAIRSVNSDVWRTLKPAVAGFLGTTPPEDLDEEAVALILHKQRREVKKKKIQDEYATKIQRLEAEHAKKVRKLEKQRDCEIEELDEWPDEEQEGRVSFDYGAFFSEKQKELEAARAQARKFFLEQAADAVNGRVKTYRGKELGRFAVVVGLYVTEEDLLWCQNPYDDGVHVDNDHYCLKDTKTFDLFPLTNTAWREDVDDLEDDRHLNRLVKEVDRQEFQQHLSWAPTFSRIWEEAAKACGLSVACLVKRGAVPPPTKGREPPPPITSPHRDDHFSGHARLLEITVGAVGEDMGSDEEADSNDDEAGPMEYGVGYGRRRAGSR